VKAANGDRTDYIAAFFDLDGTLVAGPSLEWRFFAELRRRRAIATKNYFLWLREAARLAPQGLGMLQHVNKMYLRGVRADSAEMRIFAGAPAMAPPRFLAVGVKRVAWHAAQGHTIVLVSGTLAPLARGAAAALAVKLTLRGLSGSIEVCATALEELGGRWTGRISGPAMFGEAKAKMVRRFAHEHGLTLERCYAYANSMNDLQMLQAVGRPIVVNPSQELHRFARQQGWPIFCWRERKDSPQKTQRTQTRHEQIWEN
jgi:alcohol-forming fatty acyl-CoA reductase